MPSNFHFNVLDSDDEAIKLRILSIRSELFSGNNAQMAERLNITPSELSHTISGKRGIGLKIIKLIAENVPEVDINWLVIGRGKMVIDDNNTTCVSDDESAFNSSKMALVEDELKKAHDQIDILINSLKLLQERCQRSQE